MIVEVITASESDTEVCVTCPNGCGFWYFDPRQSKVHCVDCQIAIERDTLHKCPECGNNDPTVMPMRTIYLGEVNFHFPNGLKEYF